MIVAKPDNMIVAAHWMLPLVVVGPLGLNPKVVLITPVVSPLVALSPPRVFAKGLKVILGSVLRDLVEPATDSNARSS